MLFSKFLLGSLASLTLLGTPVSAVTSTSHYDNDTKITTMETKTDHGTIVEGKAKGSDISTYLLAPGPITQYPSQGGTWQYGFWNAKVRSYYTVNKVHGTSVKFNGQLQRSIDTAANKKSIAEKSALNLPGNTDEYYYRIGK